MSPHEVLKKYWGYEVFRSMQEDIVRSALDGNDTLALLPTGGGKSICFQVPALCMEGVCVVISPLIALMKDQVQNLVKRGISAVALYSGLHYKEIDRLLDNAVHGGVKFLYLSPERLQTDIVQERLKRMNVTLLAIDEAHCVSQWGYDFRPPYLNIAGIRPLLPPHTPILALTATATPEVVDDIQERLAFRKGMSKVFKKSFSRPNLAYVVLPETKKLEKALNIFQNVGGSGLIYVRNRGGTRDAAEFLRKHGISADFYHAGLSNEERSKKQEDWISGKIRIMAATNAFGMGIDKPDVRAVVHTDVPDNLEAYFQEAGRAGRDGNKSFCVLLYNIDVDHANLEYQFEQSYPDLAEIKNVYRALGSLFQLAVGGGQGDSYDFDLLHFANTFNFNAVRAHNCLKVLQQAGWIDLTESVSTPALLQILVSKEELYDFIIRQPNQEKVLNAVLRLYDGAHLQAVPLRERELADFLKIKQTTLQEQLLNLQTHNIITYQPPKQKPQLIFTRERVSADNLSIDQKRYAFLKERHRARLDATLAYCEVARCRSQQLLAYFGETDSAPCGKCDVCTGRTVAPTETEEQKLQKQILELIKKSPKQDAEALLTHFPESEHDKVYMALDFLIDEGFLDTDEEDFLVIL